MQQSKGLVHEYLLREKAGILRMGEIKAWISLCVHQPNFVYTVEVAWCSLKPSRPT